MRERVLLLVNVVSALISAVFGLLALASPSATPGVDAAGLTSDATFYAAMYGVRALVIAAVLTVLAVRRVAGGSGPGLVPVVLLAGAVQAGDVVIGAVTGQPGMVAGAAVATVIHLGSAALLARGAHSLRPAR